MSSENKREIRVTAELITTHDTPDNWAQESVKDFVPAQGRFIVYDETDESKPSRVKIGNGKSSIADLPFMDEPVFNALKSYINNFFAKGSVLQYARGDGTIGSFNTTFVGTKAEYTTAYNAGNIPVGTIVVITDESDDDTENAGASSSILGTGVLGYMVLG